MLEKKLLVRPMRHGHDIDIAEFRARFAPVTMGQDMMPPDFAPCLDFAAGRYRPMKKSVEAGHPHAGR